MDKLTAYREKIEAQLKEWKSTIEILEEKAAKATGETKADLMVSIQELRKKKDVVKENWSSLQKESGIAWETMKDGVEKAASELKSAMDKVIARFK